MIDYKLLEKAWTENHPGEPVPKTLDVKFRSRIMFNTAPDNDPFVLEKIDEMVEREEFRQVLAGLTAINPPSIGKWLENAAKLQAAALDEQIENTRQRLIQIDSDFAEAKSAQNTELKALLLAQVGEMTKTLTERAKTFDTSAKRAVELLDGKIQAAVEIVDEKLNAAKKHGRLKSYLIGGGAVFDVFALAILILFITNKISFQF